MSFQIQALPETLFSKLFSLTDAELESRHAKRVLVGETPGFPCRVSLADAQIGETVLLLNYEHQPNDTPYRATHAIFVREGVSQATPAPGEVPDALASRLLSVRGFNRAHDMIDADVVNGTAVAERIDRLFENPDIDYIHLHNARPGCFAASVTRV